MTTPSRSSSGVFFRSPQGVRGSSSLGRYIVSKLFYRNLSAPGPGGYVRLYLSWQYILDPDNLIYSSKPDEQALVGQSVNVSFSSEGTVYNCVNGSPLDMAGINDVYGLHSVGLDGESFDITVGYDWLTTFIGFNNFTGVNNILGTFIHGYPVSPFVLYKGSVCYAVFKIPYSGGSGYSSYFLPPFTITLGSFAGKFDRLDLNYPSQIIPNGFGGVYRVEEF